MEQRDMAGFGNAFNALNHSREDQKHGGFGLWTS